MTLAHKIEDQAEEKQPEHVEKDLCEIHVPSDGAEFHGECSCLAVV